MGTKHEHTEGGSRPLYHMFIRVPSSYDMMNRLLTLGLDERWRKKAAKTCLAASPTRVMDLCTGTGDMVMHLSRLCKNGKCELLALDFSPPMLNLAIEKAAKKALIPIRFTEGDVASMPYENGYFDAVTLGFAFRNLTFRNPRTVDYLSEILRIIRKDGRLVIVETAQPGNRLLKFLFRIYMKVFVARLGGWISGHRAAYRYLAYSAINYYAPAKIKELLLQNGFSRVEDYPLMGGIAAIYVAVK
ncbi:MAG: ubiquinone/menaquinone biosynthesis methyltransferase [Bacteroidales bacterium]